MTQLPGQGAERPKMTPSATAIFSLDHLDVFARPNAKVEKRQDKYHAGCWVHFDNDWTVSIQWGNGNYSDNYHRDLDAIGDPPQDSTTAEIAAWKGDKADLVTWWGGDTVQGYVEMSRVQQVLDLAAADHLLREYQPPTPPPELRAYVPGDPDPDVEEGNP